jgi:hypothetical protein
LLHAPELKPFLSDETLPGPHLESDDELLDFARRNGSTTYHLIGTARMGPNTDPTAVVDDRLRHESDRPTIGLILCQQPNRVLAEYALRGMDKPIGVSSFELTRALPESLESSLPTIEEIERELEGDA